MPTALDELNGKLRELTGRRQTLQDEIRALSGDIETLTRCLRILGYQDPATPSPPSAGDKPKRTMGVQFQTGELTSAVLEALRDADQPLDSSAIAASIIKAKNIDQQNVKMGEMASRVSSSLTSLLKRSRVEKIENGPDRPRWQIAR